MSDEHEEYDAVMNCTIMRLRARAEKAEAELAALRASLADEDHPPHDEEHGCMSHSCLIATRVGGVGTNGPCTCIDSNVQSRAKARIIERALQRGKKTTAALAELRAAFAAWIESGTSLCCDSTHGWWYGPGGTIRPGTTYSTAEAAMLAWYRSRKGEKDER